MNMEKQVKLSVVIKAFNEERMIEHCLSAIFQAIQHIASEIILVDSLSTDETVRIASRFPISIIQLVDSKDRCCGVGGQIGFLRAKGEFLLMIDGDMLLRPDFIDAALNEMEKSPKLGAVSGFLSEKSDSLEYTQRMSRKTAPVKAGPLSHLSGGGLYRMAALRDISYFTNLNLHSCEELEVGLRLNSKGWEVRRIPVFWVDHFGHAAPLMNLMRNRLRSGYFLGIGELLQLSLGKPYFLSIIQGHIHLILTVLWWALLLILAIFAALTSTFVSFLPFIVAFFLAPFILMILKKRRIFTALYSVLTWNVQAYAMLAGLVRPLRDPLSEVPTRTIQ